MDIVWFLGGQDCLRTLCWRVQLGQLLDLKAGAGVLMGVVSNRSLRDLFPGHWVVPEGLESSPKVVQHQQLGSMSVD